MTGDGLIPWPNTAGPLACLSVGEPLLSPCCKDTLKIILWDEPAQVEDQTVERCEHTTDKH